MTGGVHDEGNTKKTTSGQVKKRAGLATTAKRCRGGQWWRRPGVSGEANGQMDRRHGIGTLLRDIWSAARHLAGPLHGASRGYALGVVCRGRCPATADAGTHHRSLRPLPQGESSAVLRKSQTGLPPSRTGTELGSWWSANQETALLWVLMASASAHSPSTCKGHRQSHDDADR